MYPNNEPKEAPLEKDKGWGAIKYYREPSAPKIIQWIMKYSGGLIKNTNQAGYVLFTFIIITFGTSLYLFFG